jgi:SAM-dependent methyltransferase
MNWRVKGVIQGLLSAVPGGCRANTLLQHTVGEMRHFDKHVASKVEDWKVFIVHFRELDFDLRTARVLEIGTGWMPILPLCFWLAGVRSFVTFDLTRHLNRRLTGRMLEALEGHLDGVADACGRDRGEVRADYARMRGADSLQDLLARGRIEYHAPADVTRSGLPDGSVDVVLSNSVLEHVPRDVILSMMRESARVLRPGGLAVHSVNCGDHYAYFDRSITPINYLTYTDEQWGKWNNALLYQNRLRPCELVGLAEEAGLSVRMTKHRPRPELMAVVGQMQIAPQFRHFPPEQLCCTSIDFAAEKCSGAAEVVAPDGASHGERQVI